MYHNLGQVNQEKAMSALRHKRRLQQIEVMIKKATRAMLKARKEKDRASFKNMRELLTELNSRYCLVSVDIDPDSVEHEKKPKPQKRNERF